MSAKRLTKPNAQILGGMIFRSIFINIFVISYPLIWTKLISLFTFGVPLFSCSEVAYKELIEELRYNLRAREDEPMPVYPFGHDWRTRLEDIENLLDKFIREVIVRTKLLQHYHKVGYSNDLKINLVVHSMSGRSLKFLAPENLVCVTPSDYGYWEIGDKLLHSVGGFTVSRPT